MNDTCTNLRWFSRLQFLELQLELLDDFRVRVLQVMKSERQDPLTSHYPAILNTVHHIATTLNDWADLPVSFVWLGSETQNVSNILQLHSSALLIHFMDLIIVELI